MTKKPTKTGVGRRLDKVEREICLILAGNKCEWCGCEESLSWAHIVKRGRKVLRWDRNNSMILCSKGRLVNEKTLAVRSEVAEYLGTTETSCHWLFDNLMTDRMRYRLVNKIKPDVYNHLDMQVGLSFDLTIKQMQGLLKIKKQELKELRGMK